MEFHRIAPAEIDWERLDAFDDRTVFQTRAWLDFIAETQGARPLVAELRDGGAIAGYFTGLTFQRMGVGILGSGFPGWTTPYIGFNLLPHVSRREALVALERFAFRDLKVFHFEVADRRFTLDDGAGLGFSHHVMHSFETDLRPSEEQIYQNMEPKSCRWCIRRAEKAGVRIEEAVDDAFADDYYEQLKEVFAKRGLVPNYGVERVRSLMRHLLPTGRLLLLRARDPEGRCIATGIYPAMNRVAVFWGNASSRAGLNLRPNELLNWHAMRYWKRRGIEHFDWGGGGAYKEKYGVRPLPIVSFRKSRFAVLETFRQEAKAIVALRQRLLGRLKRDGTAAAAAEARNG